jgi:hypothetical protein
MGVVLPPTLERGSLPAVKDALRMSDLLPLAAAPAPSAGVNMPSGPQDVPELMRGELAKAKGEMTPAPAAAPDGTIPAAPAAQAERLPMRVGKAGASEKGTEARAAGATGTDPAPAGSALQPGVPGVMVQVPNAADALKRGVLFSETGKPLPLSTLRSGKLVNHPSGPGRYFVVSDEPLSAEPRYVMGADGKRFVLDLNTILPRLKSRLPAGTVRAD